MSMLSSTNRKKLHLHSVPLLLFAITAIVVVLTAVGTAAGSANGKSGDLLTALTHPLVKVTATKSGLAHVELNQPAGQAQEVSPVPESTGFTEGDGQTSLSGISGLGSATAFQAAADASVKKP